MATKTINGSYAAGYYLDPAYQGLRIGPPGYVGGTGVTTSATQPSIVVNWGTVHGTDNGITLSDGGRVTNGSATNATALIEGDTPIVANGGPATINNYGIIEGGTGIALNDGGTVTNFATGQITSGITIAGTQAKVTNTGTISGPTFLTSYNRYDGDVYDGGTNKNVFYQKTGYSIQLTAGGSVTNGTSTNISANILNGVQIAGGAGTVTNNGTMGGVKNYAYARVTYYSGGNPNYGAPYYDGSSTFTASSVGPSVSLLDGGTVTNGTGGNGAADISNGIVIAGAAGNVTNLGTIGGGPGRDLNFIFDNYYLYSPGNFFSNVTTPLSVTLYAGGSVTNGSPGDTSATITSGIGVSGGTGTVVNYASIAGGVSLTAGGSVTNGSAADTTATITGTVSGSGGATIHNYGAIDDSGGTAVSLGSAADRLIEEASGTIDGTVVGGIVELPGDAGAGTFSSPATNATIILDAGASWSLPGTFNGVTVQNFGTASGIAFGSSNDRLLEEGSGVLNGAISGGGSTLELAGDVGPGTLTGLGGTITGFASVLVDTHSAWVLQGATVAQGTTVSNDGTLTLRGSTVNSGEIDNLAGATLAFRSDDSITTDPAIKAGGFDNAGLLRKIAGMGTSIVRTGTAALLDTGTIDVETGTLELTGAAPSIAGLIEGKGTIEFGPGNTTLNAGTDLESGGWTILGTGAHVTPAISLSYAGNFSLSTNAELTVARFLTLTLNGAATFSHAAIDGMGQLATNGATSLANTTLGDSVQWNNGGALTETGLFTIAAAHASSFTNETGATFDLAGNVGITGTGTGGFDNAGLLAKTAGTAASTIAIALANTGTVEVGTGTLDLADAVTGSGGTLQIDSGNTLEADAAVGMGQTVLFGGTGDNLTLNDAADFQAKLSGFAATDAVDLTQFGTGTTLAYSGNASHGTLTVTDGALQAKLILLGQYAAAGFAINPDSHSGSVLTYTPPPSPNLATDQLAMPNG